MIDLTEVRALADRMRDARTLEEFAIVGMPAPNTLRQMADEIEVLRRILANNRSITFAHNDHTWIAFDSARRDEKPVFLALLSDPESFVKMMACFESLPEAVVAVIDGTVTA